MNVLSLFDGISCARVALDRAGIKVDKYFASEIDKYAIQIAKKNYPDIEHIGDVTKIKIIPYNDYKVLKNNNKDRDGLRCYNDFTIKDIDLVIGGFPCQSFSIAGNRKGFLDDRGKLFYEFKRIISEAQPKYFIGENVASMSKETQKIISEELWGIEPVMIDAALVSAQRRRRLFWVGRWNGKTYEKVDIAQPKDRGIFLKDILESDVPFNKYGVELKKSNTIRTSGRGSGVNDKRNWDTIRVGSLNSGGQADRIYSPEGKSVALSANGGGRGAKTGLYAVGVANRTRNGKKQLESNKTSKANALTSVTTDSMVMQDFQVRKLTPVECERLQSLPDEYTAGASNSQRYKMLGNAFNVDVVLHILKSLYKGVK